MRITTIGQATAILTQVANATPRLRQAITDAQAGQPRAASYDTPTATVTPWCWTHQRTITECHANGSLCDGEVIHHHDPTGTAATSNDPARQALKDLEHIERQAINLALRALHLRQRWLPTPDELPTEAARAKLATSGEPGCFYCEAIGDYSPAHTAKPTTVSGNLTTPRWVCSSHYFGILRSLGRAPFPNETRTFKRTGKWPKPRAA